MPGIDVDQIEDDWAEEEPGRRRPPRKKLSVKAQAKIAEHETARVVLVDRGRVTVLFEGEEVEARYAGAMRGKKVVVGDDVRVKPPRHETDQARITDLMERRTYLTRTADDAVDEERTVVANADQIVVVLTAEWLEGGVGFLDRVLVAASAGGLKGIVCVNKMDLVDDGGAAVDALAAIYEPLGYPLVRTSATESEGLDDLRELLVGKWSAFAGHSGVGKTSLFNELVPGVQRAVAAIGRRGGRHTTVAARANHIEDLDAWLVDTPGVRSFGLAQIEPESMVEHFPEFADLDPKQLQALVNGERIDVPGANPRRLTTYHRFRDALVEGRIDIVEPEDEG